MEDKYKITHDSYNRLAKAYEEKFMENPLYIDSYDDFCRFVTKKNATIFDIACGPGNISKYLLNKRPDYQIFGIDVAPNMIKLAKKNNPTAEFQTMDCRDINSSEDMAYIYYHSFDYLQSALNDNELSIVDFFRKDYPEQDGTNTIDLFIIAQKNL